MSKKLTEQGPFQAPLLTTVDIQRMTGASHMTVYNWQQRGRDGVQLKSKRIGRRVFFTEKDFKKFATDTNLPLL